VAMMVEQLVTLGICVALLLRARERTARRRSAAAPAR
jgi:hypothetical protein